MILYLLALGEEVSPLLHFICPYCNYVPHIQPQYLLICLFVLIAYQCLNKNLTKYLSISIQLTLMLTNKLTK